MTAEPKNQYVFQCKKCQHNIYVSLVKQIRNLTTIECSSCGESGDLNWIFNRMGNYEREHK